MAKTNSKTRELSPEKKLMKAIFGKNGERYNEVMDRHYRHQAESVTDEEFKKMWGVSPEEHTRHMLEFVGWCKQVTSWQAENGVFTKGARERGSLRVLTDMAKHFYEMGRRDEKSGTTPHERLWPGEKQGE